MNSLALILACALGSAEADGVRMIDAQATATRDSDQGAVKRESPETAATEPDRENTSIESILDEPPTYTGEPIDLELTDAPIQQVIRLLAEIGGYSYVLDPAVDGKVTIHLKAVPWDQALALILRSHGLGFDVEGSALLIADP
ncbi:MAG: secretin and TonB N-terminal domain-containing protein [Acidobacteriota bacterium]